MKSFVFLLLSLSALELALAQPDHTRICAYSRKRYTVYTHPLVTYHEAISRCQENDQRLATILDREQNHCLAELINSAHPHEGSRFWTSGNNFQGHFVWQSTGQPVHYFNWAYDQPTHEYGPEGETQHCIAVKHDLPGPQDPLPWHNDWCSQRHMFVCED